MSRSEDRRRAVQGAPLTLADLERIFSGGFCHGEKRAECETCQRRERAIEHVRRMADVVRAAQPWDTTVRCAPGCDCAPCRLSDAVQRAETRSGR